jgi:hypothetical protein
VSTCIIRKKNNRVTQIFSRLSEQKKSGEKKRIQIDRKGWEQNKCLRGESNVESINQSFVRMEPSRQANRGLELDILEVAAAAAMLLFCNTSGELISRSIARSFSSLFVSSIGLKFHSETIPTESICRALLVNYALRFSTPFLHLLVPIPILSPFDDALHFFVLLLFRPFSRFQDFGSSILHPNFLFVTLRCIALLLNYAP